MKEEIKNLRVKIDGLSQLVKQLKSPCKYVVPLSVIPDGVSAVDVIEMFKQQLPVLFVEDNPDSVHKINSNEIDKGEYLKLCGQRYWEFISGDENLYLEMIKPLGQQVKEKDEQFEEKYAQKVNEMTQKMLEYRLEVTD